jgi:hypothetical protein
LATLELLLPDVAGIASTSVMACVLVVGDAPVTTEPDDDVAVPAAVSSDDMPELILTNCCRLFTSTICVMYVFGSVGCVGSWFFISATSSVKKSFAVIVAAAADDVDEAVEDVGVVALGFDMALATFAAELDIWVELVNICGMLFICFPFNLPLLFLSN